MRPSRSICIHYLLILIALFLADAGLNAQLPSDTLFLDNRDEYPLSRHLYYYKTERSIEPAFLADSLRPSDFRKLSPEEALNEGFSTCTFWMAFTLKNTTAAPKDLMLQLNNPNLNEIRFYQGADSGFLLLYTTGITRTFDSRPYIYYDFVFPVRLEPGQALTYVLMASKKTEIFSTKPILISNKAFKRKEERLYIIMGFMIGIMLFNIIINLFLWVSLKDKIHLLYAVYVVATLLWLFSSLGLDFQFLFPRHPGLYAISQPVTGGITMVFMAQLAIVFLGLKRRNSKVKTLLNIAKIIVLIQTPLWYIIYYRLPEIAWVRQIQSNLFLAAILIVSVSMVIAAIERIRQGYRPAWFYLVAMLYLSFGIVKTCYTILGSADISGIVTPPTDVQTGLIVESIIIFMGIIYRYNLYKKEKDQLMKQILQQQQVSTQQIITAQEEERKRIAQDLHDDVGATLSTLLLHISNIPESGAWPIDDARKHNERSISISKKALSDLRLISRDLLPKDFATLGINQILNQRVDELNNIGNIVFDLQTEGNDQLLDDIASVTLYRVINELISNVIKHSMASSCSIQLIINEETRSVMLLMEDNGIGLPSTGSHRGIGLKNIYSRIAFLEGSINIDSNTRGTSIIIEMPLKPKENGN